MARSDTLTEGTEGKSQSNLSRFILYFYSVPLQARRSGADMGLVFLLYSADSAVRSVRLDLLPPWWEVSTQVPFAPSTVYSVSAIDSAD